MADIPYSLGCAIELQAESWYKQYRLEEARSEALHAASVYKELGAEDDIEDLLLDICKRSYGCLWLIRSRL